MKNKKLLFGCLTLILLAIVFVSCTSYMMSTSTESNEEKKEAEKQNENRVKKMKEDNKKEDAELNKKLDAAKDINQADFDNKVYKHEQAIKIQNGKVNGVAVNELGMQTAIVSMYDNNNVVVGTYPIVNYSDVKLENNKSYNFVGTYDLKTNDNEPSLDIWRVK
ncbi:hypothetical protein [Macrococcus capreoli]|uniref:hypothetical protein n=1 Tax=Macrococcus capreoli TaxID=2982690 RepID=UPI003EE46266